MKKEEFIMRYLLITKLFRLFAFVLIIFVLLGCSTNSVSIPRMENGKAFLEYCKKISSYTIIIEGIGYQQANTGNADPAKAETKVKLTAYRVGLRANPEADIYPNLENLFQSAIGENLKEFGNKRARYVSPDALGIMNNSIENEQTRNQWMAKAGIDTLVVLSPSFVLDYPTRISSDAFAKFFTLFVLDWWYIDLMGVWYIENNYNLQVVDLKNNQIVGNISSAKVNHDTGKYFLSQIDSNVFEKSIKESMALVFKSAKGEKK
ncbi:MAG: hypothetical protein IPG24_11255 [Leptospiraceae bacterium]|nr:hypothetical protein [Leptospiraceae bacterium]